MLIKQSPPISTPNTSIFLDSHHDDQEISYKLNIEDIKKVDNSSNKIQLSKNNKVIHNAELKIKEIKNVNKIDSNNYVYLGSTNMSLLNNMGLTLEEDGSLLLIKGKTHDLFTGLYQKYIRGGFKYQGFNIKNKEGSELKFKELYVDADGFLIGKKKDDNNDVNELYKIKFSKIEESYSLNDNQESNKNFIVEYEPYIPRKNEVQDLSSINNVIEQDENNEIHIRRKGFEVGIKLENNKLLITGLTGFLTAEITDELDGSLWHDIKLPLKKQDKILAIKPVLNRVQIVIKRDDKIKIYYLNPSHIFAVKPYEYQVSRLTKTPPMSFYSMVGENNYNNYHSGQPYSSQTVGNFSSRHIPFFSSFIDNARIHFDKAKESYALKKYSKLASNMAKSVDPGFRGLFSGIRALTNSTTTPAKTKYIALNNAKLNIDQHFKVLGRTCKNIENGRTHGEIIQTLTQEMKKKESIMLSHYNDIRAFFGISAFNLTDKLGVNAFALASYAKTHTLIINKNKDDEITFSFINEKNINTSVGLSAGVGTYEKRSNYNSIDYGVVTPAMASVVLNANYAKSSDFSFNIPLNEITEFIDNRLNITEHELIDKTKLETNTSKEISLGIESRAEISGDIDVMLNKTTGVTVPRNAIGLNMAFNILKIDANINKIINAGEMDVINEKKEINLGLFEFVFEAYRDLKFTPSSTTANSEIQWYPLTTVRDFETMLKRKVNYLFNRTIFSSESIKNKDQEEKSKKEMKYIYKRIVKLNKLIDKYPEEYSVSKDIGKLSDIYLTLSSDKSEKNKLKDSIKNKNEVEINYYNKLKDFLSELKEKAETLSSQKKDNMNEKFNPFFTTNYTLTKESKDIRASFIQSLKQLFDENTILFKEDTKAKKETKKLDIKKLNTELDELYQKYKVELKKVAYQIDAIDVMSVSELAFKKKTLPTGFVRLGNKKAITHSQVKGNIRFSYDIENQKMNKITSSYYFN